MCFTTCVAHFFFLGVGPKTPKKKNDAHIFTTSALTKKRMVHNERANIPCYIMQKITYVSPLGGQE